MTNPLHDLATTLPPGKLSAADASRVLTALTECWASLRGSTDEKTLSNKLDRAEVLTWDPPILSFVLERHGATVNGSRRAALHYWEVNTEDMTAHIARKTYRQLIPRSSPMGAEVMTRLAQEIADLIVQSKENPRITWLEKDQRVQINIGQIIPKTNAQTTQSRRARLSIRLSSMLASVGWNHKPGGRPWVFHRS